MTTKSKTTSKNTERSAAESSEDPFVKALEILEAKKAREKEDRKKQSSSVKIDQRTMKIPWGTWRKCMLIQSIVFGVDSGVVHLTGHPVKSLEQVAATDDAGMSCSAGMTLRLSDFETFLGTVVKDEVKYATELLQAIYGLLNKLVFTYEEKKDELKLEFPDLTQDTILDMCAQLHLPKPQKLMSMRSKADWTEGRFKEPYKWVNDVIDEFKATELPDGFFPYRYELRKASVRAIVLISCLLYHV